MTTASTSHELVGAWDARLTFTPIWLCGATTNHAAGRTFLP
jgi:hypothetical protein